jgi:uncharacterized coiled-coil protein SlyX
MKAILYVVVILVAGGAAYFTLEQNRKFEELQTVRLKTITDNKQVSANASAKEQELKDEKGVLEKTREDRDVLTQSISALKSTAATLEREVAELDNTLAGQKEEFAELEKTLAEVNEILKDLGGDVNLDNLPEKVVEIDEDRNARVAKLEELETLVSSAEKMLAKSRSEFDRLVKRDIERNSRIGRNAMESVVTAVNQDWGFIVIGAGSNSGFTPQTSLIVQRDGRMIGRVRPSSIEPTQTIAEIDFDTLAPGVRLQPGDHVILAKPITN